MALEARGVPVEVVARAGCAVPEVADIVATLRVLHDAGASAPLARLLADRGGGSARVTWWPWERDADLTANNAGPWPPNGAPDRSAPDHGAPNNSAPDPGPQLRAPDPGPQPGTRAADD